MSLDDSLEPKSKEFIDRIDGKLIEAHKKIADFWQGRTYTQKDALAGVLYGISSYFFFVGFLGDQAILLLPSIIEGEKSFFRLYYEKTDVEATVLSRVALLRGKFDKYLSIGTYAFGVFLTFAGTSFLYNGIKMNDNRCTSEGITFFSAGLGLVCGMGGKYIDLSNTPDPPKKPKKESLLKRIENGLRSLFPEPAAVPIHPPSHSYAPISVSHNNLYK